MEVKKIDGVPTYDPKDPRFITVAETLPNGETVDVIYRKGMGGLSREQMDAMRNEGKMVSNFSYCAPLNVRTYDATPDIVCMQDIAVTMRDGVKIYADIYLPKNTNGPVPLIISWGPFGKRASEGTADW